MTGKPAENDVLSHATSARIALHVANSIAPNKACSSAPLRPVKQSAMSCLSYISAKCRLQAHLLFIHEYNDI